jgi:DNA-directed RNA polymerase subunit L
VFKTIPYEENKANIMVNTSRLNNEIVKQRLGCIPICAAELDESQLKNYLLEVDVENKTDTNLIVTTKDFKIKNLVTDKYLDDNTMKKIFPPYIPPTGNGEYYIDFLRLRPNITKDLPGEKIKLTCELSISNARYDSMFNVVGTCAYGCTPDREKMAEQLAIRKQKWKDEDKTEAEIQFEAANWNLLEGLRYVKSKSFDFIIQSLGIYDNTEIIIKSCDIVINNLENIKHSLDQDEMEIKPSINTMDNSYDITLVNNDYTIGNILNYELYSVFYQELKALDYIGFKKMHPHDNDSIIRVSVSDKTKGVSAVKTMLNASIEEAIKKLESIKGCFNGSRK